MRLAGWGFPCPDCGQDYKANVTAFLKDVDNYDIGITLHCPKCEKVWDEIFISGEGRAIVTRELV